MVFNRLSIKYKTLIAIVSLPVILLTGYSFISINAIEKDKIAYVYDAGLSTTDTIARFFDSTLMARAKDIATYKSYDHEIRKRMLEVHEEHLMLVLDGQVVYQRPFEKLQDTVIIVDDYLKTGEGINLKIVDEKNGVFALLLKDKFGLMGKNGIVFQSLDMLGQLKQLKDEEYQVIDSHFNKLISKGQIDLKKSTLESFLSGDVRSGARKVQLKEDYVLMAFTKLNRFPLTVISLTPGRVIENSLSSFFYQFVFMLILLFSISIIAALILSSGLTNSLLVLDYATDEISKGNYSLDLKVTSKDEIGNLTSKFKMMAQKVKTLIDDLSELNRSLERKVAERTAELQELNTFLKAILDSLDQGLIVFDKNGKALGNHSVKSEELLGFNPEGSAFERVINDPERNNEINLWYNTSIDEKLPFESLKELAPKVVVSNPELVLKTDYFPIRKAAGEISNIILSLKDVTQEAKAKKAAEEREQFAKSVVSIARDRSKIFSVIRGIKDFLDLLKSDAKVSREVLMREIHTIKGSAAVFGIYNIQEFSGDLEDSIAKEGVEYSKIIQGYNQEIEIFFEKFNMLISKEQQFEDNIEVSYKVLKNFEGHLKSNSDLLNEFHEKILFSPIENSFKQFESVLIENAEELGKKVNPIVFKDTHVKWDAKKYEELVAVFIHLFRNIIDHGVETVEQRLSLGKPQSGVVQVQLMNVSTWQEDGFYQFEISDDGNGIDTNKLRQKLSQKPDLNIDGLSDQEIMQYIFVDSVSTRDSKTALSGLGVGMSAVKAALEQAGGSITVDSEKLKGTIFKVQIKVMF